MAVEDRCWFHTAMGIFLKLKYSHTKSSYKKYSKQKFKLASSQHAPRHARRTSEGDWGKFGNAATRYEMVGVKSWQLSENKSGRSPIANMPKYIHLTISLALCWNFSPVTLRKSIGDQNRILIFHPKHTPCESIYRHYSLAGKHRTYPLLRSLPRKCELR